MKFLLRNVRAVVFACFSLALASASADEAGAITSYPKAELVESNRLEVNRYQIVLSELKRSDATHFAEQSVFRSGQLQRRLFSLPRRSELANVIQHYQQQMQQGNFQLLYQCTGRDCGSSHFWANQVFDNAVLVTREHSKHYIAMQRATDQGVEVVTLYIAQRGSRQILVNADVMVLDKPISLARVSNEDIRKKLRSQSGWLPGLIVANGVIDETASSPLLEELKSLAGPDRENLHLTVHCYTSSNMGDNIRCSEKLADQVRLLTFNNTSELSVYAQGALTEAPNQSLLPSVRFIYWPKR